MPVVVEFESGLGNQLFQFAAGYHLAEKKNTRLIADTSRYLKPAKPGGRVTWRPFILQELGFPMEYRPNPPAALFNIRGVPRLHNLFRNRGLTRYSCPGAYTPAWDSLPKDCYLSGYFQDRRYLPKSMKPVSNIILRQLKKAAEDKGVKAIPHNWGAVHVRLGDYLDTPEFYPEWFQNYTPSVVQELLESHRCAKVLVFSDQPEKAAEMLKKFGDRIEIASSDFALEGSLDLYRMSTATVLAIANSSFSWWAAQIAHQTGSRIIAPRFWSEWLKDPEGQIYDPEWDVFGDDLGQDGLKPQSGNEE